MNQPLNPVQLENEILATTNSVVGSIPKVSEAYNTWQQAVLEQKKAFAKTYLTSKGSVEERKQQATLHTMDTATAEIVAEVTYRRLLDYQKAYREKLSAYQSLTKSVVAAYQSQGSGYGG